MRYVVLINLLWLTVIGCVYAQTQPHPPENEITGSDDGTLACKPEIAIVKIMKTMKPPHFLIDGQVMNDMIKKGDCLIIPEEWVVLLQKDPPLEQQEDHASQWTIKTPNGIIHMWGAPMGGD